MSDQLHLGLLRENVERFLAREAAWLLEGPNALPLTVLEVGGEGRAYGPRFFPGCAQRTLDLTDQHRPDIVADLCSYTQTQPHFGLFDVVICTEVLEHVRRPWDAATTLRKLLKRDGTLLLSTPLNLFIHYPSPDLWRFTEDGLRELLELFTEVRVEPLETPGRAGFPIQYTVVARR